MSRPSPLETFPDLTARWVSLFSVMPDAGSAVMGPAPGDDDFDGVALASKWTTYLAGTTATISVSGGRVDANPQDGVSTGLTVSPNRAPGPRIYQPVTGDFVARLRVWARNNTDTGDVATNIFYTGLLASETESGVSQWLGVEQGFESGVVRRVRYSAVSTGTLSTVAATEGSLHADLEISRTGQVFGFRRRDYSAVVPLSSGSGWVDLGTVDRTSSSPLAATMLVGPVVRASSAAASAGRALWEEFLLYPRANATGTEITRRVAISRWRSDVLLATNTLRVRLPTHNAGTALGFGLWDAESGGTLLAFGTFAQPLPLVANRELIAYAEGITITG